MLEERKGELLATFRYVVRVYTGDYPQLSNVGRYVISVEEEPTKLSLTSVIPSGSEDLLDVLNGNKKIKKVVVEKKDSYDNTIITSTYLIGNLITWKTFGQSVDSGVYAINVRGRLISNGDSPEDYSNNINLDLNGVITDTNNNRGNNLSTIKIDLVVRSFTHKLGEVNELGETDEII